MVTTGTLRDEREAAISATARLGTTAGSGVA
jgi:hypothetical protein